MKTIALNEVNDIYIDKSGNLVIAEEKEALRQICLTATRTVYGELPFNTNFGIPYFDILYTGKSNLDLFRFYLQRIILSIENILSIKSIKFVTNNNQLSYNIIVNSSFGELSING